MFRPQNELQITDIAFSAGLDYSSVSVRLQQNLIAEAIRSWHTEAINAIFKDQWDAWPGFPVVDRVPAGSTVHHSLGPILENEGTLDGTYRVIDEIFLDQLKLDRQTDFADTPDGPIYLTYDDQKTISPVSTAKLNARRPRAHTTDIHHFFLFPVSSCGG